jgi:hypothetical protein
VTVVHTEVTVVTVWWHGDVVTLATWCSGDSDRDDRSEV